MRPREIITTDMLITTTEYCVLISNMTGAPVDDILGTPRKKEVSEARHLLMWTLVTVLGYTPTATGILLHRHRSTVITANEMFSGRFCGKRVEELKQKILDYEAKRQK